MKPLPATSGAMVALFAFVFAPPTLGEEFKPNLRGDHVPGGCTRADCTLREAVLAANANGGADKIVLRAGRPYRLGRQLGPDDPGTGDLDVEDSLTIRTADGGQSTIKVGETDDRVLDVEWPTRLRGLKLVGAPGTYSDSDSGGVILATADLALKKVVVKNGNTAVTGGSGGGISIVGPANLALNRSQVVSNRSGQLGGGIERGGSGAFTLVKSTVAGNVATTSNGLGGGVALGSSGLGRISESTVSGNLAHTDGGGIHVSEVFDLDVENSTFEGNAARGFGGGIFVAPESPTTMNAVTVTRNRADSENDSTGQGGGMWAEGGEATLFVRNSLLARNRTTDAVYEQCDAPTPVDIESEGGNVLDTAASGCNFFGDPTDITGTQPGIRPLDFYGGPTKTVALGPSSGAIDEADGPQPPARDQRGVKREDPDAGAYER